MFRTISTLKTFGRDIRGGTAIEYGLIAALIVIAAIGAMNNFGAGLSGMWNKVDHETSNSTH